MTLVKKIGFFSALILPALVIAGYYGGGWWNYSSLGFVFLFVPAIDQLVGLDPSNTSKEKQGIIGEEFYYRFITYLWVYVQLALILWACYVIATKSLQGPVEWIGFTVGVALVTGGIGITVAHELGHKKSQLERFYSLVLLMTVGYMHFYIEHNRGHHLHVATPQDPATAKRNQDFYRFWFQTTFGSIAHAWQLESNRLEKQNKSLFNIYNQMIWFIILPILFYGLLTLDFSVLSGKFIWQIPIFLIVQGILAFSLLELVNYVEHYGIIRKEISPGQYERVNPMHSWNTSYLVSNFFLFQLQRHSDHHDNALKRYQVLNHVDESPQLPYGYPTMILIALVPPIWFSMMNKRLEDWERLAIVG